MSATVPFASASAARLAEARACRAELERQLAEYSRLEKELFSLEAATRPWDPPARKARLWEVRDLLPGAAQQLAQQINDTIARYRQALEQGGRADARAELADLCWSLLVRAEERHEDAEAQRFLALLAESDDGRYEDLVEGTGTLALDSDPPGAQVWLRPIVEQQRQLTLGDAQTLGATPLGPVDVGPGRYALELRVEGHAVVRRPLVVQRGVHLQVRVRLFAHSVVGPDFVQISAGRFRMGGDPEAPGAGPAQDPFVDNFAIATHPVTIGEYLLFLDDLAASDPARALAYAPRFGVGPDPRLPVTGVTLAAARAYCAWRSAEEGVLHRLPDEEQWEKAARGADGRGYPWGDFFDPSLCLMRASAPGGPALQPVGALAADASIYGVRDMGGGVAEWTESDFDETRQHKTVRGGSFEEGAAECRCARRAAVAPEQALRHVGFRVLRPLPPGGGEAISPPAVPLAPGLGARRPRRDLRATGERLLAVCRKLGDGSPAQIVDELLAEAVQLAGAERGFVVDAEGDELRLRCSCNAAARPMPGTDQRVDGELVRAAVAQRRAVVIETERPVIAFPLGRSTSALVLERRFSAQPFADEERAAAELAADLVAVALRLASPAEIPRAPVGLPLEQASADVERDLVRRTLVAEKGNISRTARRLGISRNGLRARLRRYGLVAADFAV